MINLLSYKYQRHFRDDIKKLDDADESKSLNSNTKILSEVLRTLYRKNDIDLVRDKMIDRYAKIIKSEIDEVNQTEVNELLQYRDKFVQATRQAIIEGQYEIIRIQIADAIWNQTATLFTEPGLRYEYISDQNTKMDDIAESISELRQKNDINLAMQRLDMLSCACGSAVLYLSIEEDRLIETEIPINNFHYAFGSKITYADGSTRPVNKNRLDDASVIAIQLDCDKTFAAWFGPSQKYPNGRHCVYKSTGDKWSDIPEVGAENVDDYKLDGSIGPASMIDEIGSPLVVHTNKNKLWNCPVYPFTTFLYDSTGAGLLPCTTSVYQTGLELDVAASMFLNAAIRGAKGLQIYKKGDTEMIPKSTEGLTVIDRAAELFQAGWSPSNAEAAQRVIDAQIRQICNSNHVPAWMVVRDTSGGPPSGWSLMVQSWEAIKFRERREKVNVSNVARRFDIERALINAVNGKEIINYNVRENWSAGERKFPEDSNMKLDAWKKELDMGLSDMADIIREMKNLDSRESAIKFIDQKKQEQADNANLAPAKPTDQMAGPTGIRAKFAALKGGIV